MPSKTGRKRTKQSQRLRQEARRTPVDAKWVLKVIAHAIKIGLHAFHYGSCGPAAIAINKVLFGGRATYVIATRKQEFEHGCMRGHVAVHYDGAFFDYKGKASVAELLKYVRGEFVVISDVPERLIRSFFPGEPLESAERILRQSIRDIRNRRCAAAIRKHKRDLDDVRHGMKWSSNRTTKAVAKVWKAKLDARHIEKRSKGRPRKRKRRTREDAGRLRRARAAVARSLAEGN